MANQITRGFGFDGHFNAQYGDVTQPNIACRLLLVFHSQVLVVFLVVLVFKLANKPLNLNVQSLGFNVNNFSIF